MAEASNCQRRCALQGQGSVRERWNGREVLQRRLLAWGSAGLVPFEMGLNQERELGGSLKKKESEVVAEVFSSGGGTLEVTLSARMEA